MNECQCVPWSMPREDGKNDNLCTYHGNACFHSKMRNASALSQCNCKPNCNEIDYEYRIDSVTKITGKKAFQLCQPEMPHRYYISETNPGSEDQNAEFTECENYLLNDYARVTIQIDGKNAILYENVMATNMISKLGMVGGVLSLFSGFSFIVVFEALYWIGVIAQDVLYPSDAPQPNTSVRPTQNAATKKSIVIVNGRKTGPEPSNEEAAKDVEKANNQFEEYNHKFYMLEARIKALETTKFVERRSKSPYLHAGYGK